MATILSALDGQTRKPASKAVALAAIHRHADERGCTVEDILEAAAGLLDGRMNADEFRATLRDDGATDEPDDDAATTSPNRTKTRPWPRRLPWWAKRARPAATTKPTA